MCRLFIAQWALVFGHMLTGAFCARLMEYCTALRYVILLFNTMYVFAYFIFLFCYIVLTLCSV
jgi:hypothetical protein